MIYRYKCSKCGHVVREPWQGKSFDVPCIALYEVKSGRLKCNAHHGHYLLIPGQPEPVVTYIFTWEDSAGNVDWIGDENRVELEKGRKKYMNECCFRVS